MTHGPQRQAKELSGLIESHAALPLHDGWVYCSCEHAKRIREVAGVSKASRIREAIDD